MHHKKECDPTKIVTVTFPDLAKNFTGIILGPEHGFAIGVVELWGEFETKVGQFTTAADSTHALGRSQMSDTWKAMRSKAPSLTTKVKELTGAEEATDGLVCRTTTLKTIDTTGFELEDQESDCEIDLLATKAIRVKGKGRLHCVRC